MTRLISGLVLAVVALLAILFLPLVVLRALACGVAAMAAHEYLAITGTGRRSAHVVVIFIVAYACWAMASYAPSSDVGAADPLLLVFAAMAIAVGWVAIAVLFAGRTIQDAAVDVVAPAYIGLPLGMLVGVHAHIGWRATLLLIGTIVVSDSAQYYTGRAFGRRPLAPTISPKKTIEGAVGGVIFGIAFLTVGVAFVVPNPHLLRAAILAAVVVALGIIGDLFESRLKRVAGMKDSSNLIPGHGGVLDRIDALLFATPAFYFAMMRGLL